ncbi:hypothetical protein M0802_004761 [Mischocyttarus mexicanus]|nr:hypothetical protein M0802_004761 [Mischocyttarus mexicanus]
MVERDRMIIINCYNKYDQYEPPDFNELVDDSSNELKIDMSDSTFDKIDTTRNRPSNYDKDRICKNAQSLLITERQQQHQPPNHHQHYAEYQRQCHENNLKISPTATSSDSPVSTNSPFTTTSAFRLPTSDYSKNICRSTPTVPVGATLILPTGPYPASVT